MRSLSTKRVAAVLILGLLLAPAAWAAPWAETGHGWTGIWAQAWSWVSAGWAKEGGWVDPVGFHSTSEPGQATVQPHGSTSMDKEGGVVYPDGLRGTGNHRISTAYEGGVIGPDG